MSAQELFERAKALAAAEKVELVEALLDELDRPDASIDADWAAESEHRLAAYRRGEIRASALNDVIEKYRRK